MSQPNPASEAPRPVLATFRPAMDETGLPRLRRVFVFAPEVGGSGLSQSRFLSGHNTGCRKTPSTTGFVTGHDFSRADKPSKIFRALSPAGCSFPHHLVLFRRLCGRPVLFPLLVAMLLTLPAHPQQLPRTTGETLSGHQIVLADAVRGHRVILVAGFSREGGNGTGAWVKAIQADSALAGIPVYEIAQIAGAPGLIRGMIKSSMKKSVPQAEHDTFVVLTQDEKPWRLAFDVSDDKVPCVMMMDAAGKVLWLGHGPAAELEPRLHSLSSPSNLRSMPK